MKKLFTLQLLLISISCFAQPTILSTDLATFGSTYYYKHVGTFTAIDTNLQGPNQTWDFSGVMTTVDPDYTVTIFDPTQSAHASQFPSANWGTLEGPLMDYNFFVNSTSQLERIGAYNATDGYSVYDDTQMDMVFPFTYPQYWNDSSNIVGNLFKTYFECQNLGYGTITVPGRTYTNVIMSRVILESIIPFVQYLWYSSDDGQPVFVYVPETIFTPDAAVYLYLATSTTDENELAKNLLYNNPFSSSLNVAFASGKAETISYDLTNSMGKIVRTGKFERSTFHRFSIEMENESSGIYVLTLRDNDNPERIKSVRVIKQ